jgi:cell division septal protein FtsQ
MSSRSAASSSRGGARRAGAQPAARECIPSRKSGGQAQARARRRARPRTRTRVPLLSASRLLALVLAAALVACFLWLLDGPWLRIGSVAWGGTRYTSGDDVAAILEPLKGSSLLTLDDAAVAQRLTSLPAVKGAHVEPTLPGGISVQLEEKPPALIWQTPAVRLMVAADGAVFGKTVLAASLGPPLAALPLVDDRRTASLDIYIGDRVPEPERSIALRLAAINPAVLGSSAKALQVRLDDRCGFVIAPRTGTGWAAAMGLYGMDPDPTATAARIGAQVAAIRTLFAAHRESTVGWVDARNPGKVYWRPNGPDGSDAC